jgi:hypothetical protein
MRGTRVETVYSSTDYTLLVLSGEMLEDGCLLASQKRAVFISIYRRENLISHRGNACVVTRWTCSRYCTLNSRVLSVMVCPSVAASWLGQGCRPGHRHWRSIQGVSYKSTLLHTVQGLHSGRSSSLFCTNEYKYVFSSI